MLKRVFYRKCNETASDEALVQELLSQVDERTLEAYDGSSELPTGAKDASAVESLLLRYLVAEKKSIEQASARLEKQAAWRRGWGTVSEEDVMAELQLGKVKVQLPTTGSAGRPMIIVKGKLHRPGTPPLLMNQFIYYCLEAASHYCWHPANPDGKLVAVFDLAGLQIKNLDAAALRASFTMLEQHFPERVVEIWMLEAPTIFWGIWKLVSPFIDQTTRKRIHFVYGAAAREQLVKSLGTDILPVEYGGSAAETPVEQAVQQLAAWRKQMGLEQAQPQEELAQEGAASLRVSRSSPTLAQAQGSC